MFRKEDSSFSEEKEAKRLLSVGGSRSRWTSHKGASPAPAAQRLKKSFCFFFFRKRRILALVAP
jgi:hypothetical protein